MSMRDYALTDHGLILDEDTLKYMAEKTCEDYSGDWDEDPYYYIGSLMDRFGIYEVDNFSGEVCPIGRDGDCEHENPVYFSEETIYYIPTLLAPTFLRAAYESYDEIKEEFEMRLGEALPEDFDYGSKICYISGVCFG